MRPALVLALALACSGWAAPRRLAIVYGHNGAVEPRQPLRYAEADAQRMATLFVEAGQVARDDVKLLQGRPLKELFSALDWARREARANPHVLLFVYVSSHATAAEGLLPGAEQVAWKELKRRVTQTNARARVTIVDACEASGLIESAAKEAPAFTIDAEDLLTVQGDAFITSSSSDEPSLEAGQLRGSVFTQHLVAGLRGAADVTQDGKVALDEAYRYAYERTASGESGQHPNWALRLSGYGDIIVTRIRDEGPGVIVPPGVERLVLRNPASRDVLLSAVRPSGQRLLAPAGSWLVELEREGRRKEGRLEVPAQGFGLVDEGQLTALATPPGLLRLATGDAKGCPVQASPPIPKLLELSQRLQGAASIACEQRRLRDLRLVMEDGQVRLTLDLEGRPVVLSRPASNASALLADLEALVKPH